MSPFSFCRPVPRVDQPRPEESMPPHRHAYRPVVMGRRGAVASAHPLASMAGIRILLEGGNAVDAAVAVGSTLNVVEPFMSSAGGIGLMFVSRRGGAERHVLDFIGRAPASANAARATEDELAGGPKACATPGNLGGWMAALERFGSMPRGRVLAPAIDWAEQGVPLTFMNTTFIEQARPQLGRSVEAQRLYLSNGGPRPGKIATYKELASTFRQVAEGGSEVFYRGPIAKAIARAVQEAGGWLSESDLAEFKPEWREPIRIGYRGLEVCSVPPPFSAFQMLETLNILEGYDVKGWGHNSVDYLHHLIEAIKLGSADRLAYAYSGETPIKGLLSKAYAKSQRARIDSTKAAVSEGERHNREKLPGQIAEGHPATFEDEQTTHFACADAEGTVVSVTQTLGVPFGSGFAIPGTGLVRHPADPAADAAQRARVRLQRPGGHRAAAHPRVPRPVARRRVSHSRGDTRGAAEAGTHRQRAGRLVVGGGRRAGDHARPGIRRPDGRGRPAARRLRPGDLRKRMTLKD